MAHWKVIDSYTTKIYKCSNCGAEYHDCVYSPVEWAYCPKCKSIINATISYPETTAVEPQRMKDVVILSVEKYDVMRDEIDKLEKDKERLVGERDHCIDILRKIGINYDIEIDQDTIEVEEFDQYPLSGRKRVRVSFVVEEY